MSYFVVDVVLTERESERRPAAIVGEFITEDAARLFVWLAAQHGGIESTQFRVREERDLPRPS